MSDFRIAKLSARPLLLFLLMIGLIFLCEFLLMELVLPQLPSRGNEQALIDAALLASVITPALYLLFFLPLRRQVESLERAHREIGHLQHTIEISQQLGKIGAWNLDLRRNELTWTDEAHRIFGVPLGSRLTYEDFLDRVHPEDRGLVDRKWQEAKTGRAYDVRHRIIIDDKIKWLREKAKLDFDADGTAIRAIGFVQDITDFMLMKEKAIRAGQLATVGEVSTMVAHEVNNPLSGVIGYAQVFSNRACEGCDNRELIGRIVKEGERIAKIVRGLLTFARKPDEEKKAHRVEPIIVDALNLIRAQIDKKEIALEFDIDENLPMVLCNAQQIEQVILNIVRNAYQALLNAPLEGEERRLIRLQATETERDRQRFVRIKIANNGPNIPASVLERIKEPFFTTKPAGIGTGLGLSISNDILKDHDGHLDIDSVPGEHTEMALWLPVSVSAQPLAATGKTGAEFTANQGEAFSPHADEDGPFSAM